MPSGNQQEDLGEVFSKATLISLLLSPPHPLFLRQSLLQQSEGQNMPAWLASCWFGLNWLRRANACFILYVPLIKQACRYSGFPNYCQLFPISILNYFPPLLLCKFAVSLNEWWSFLHTPNFIWDIKASHVLGFKCTRCLLISLFPSSAWQMTIACHLFHLILKDLSLSCCPVVFSGQPDHVDHLHASFWIRPTHIIRMLP